MDYQGPENPLVCNLDVFFFVLFFKLRCPYAAVFSIVYSKQTHWFLLDISELHLYILEGVTQRGDMGLKIV